MPTHPLEPLTRDEIAFATNAVKARLTDAARFSTVTLDEPPKDMLDRVRMARLVIVPGAGASVIEATVRLDTGEVESWTERLGLRPALGMEDAIYAIAALHEHAGYTAALARRGITDLSKVQIDPWPTGNFGVAFEEGRRVFRCISYLRDDPTDNGYARPIEGLLAFVDGGAREVLDVQDFGEYPIPADPGSYYPEHNAPLRDDIKPLEITQPDGPGFTLDGSRLDWQKWSLRVLMDPLEGLVLHQVSYASRSIAHRMSISEMVVPYGDPSPMHNWKNAFDAGEWGLGRMANSLKLGCDCLGEIRYLDFVHADEHGNPQVTENAICIHEEDYGIAWKHVDLLGGRTEVRRQRRLVVSFIATVGNYEYGFYWYFYLDGSIQLEVKLTGIMSTRALAPDEHPTHAVRIAPGLAAPVHQHLFCARLDLDIDGVANEVYEQNVERDSTSADNPLGNAFTPTTTLLGRESAAQRDVDPARSRVWKIVNPGVTNPATGAPVGYKLVPGSTPTLLAQPDSSIARRATFATHNLWVTPYAPDERHAAGDYPNQHVGGDGLPRWTQADRPLANTDVVVWHTFGVTHVPRPEDWPVMPVEYCGFQLIPVGFFEKNPALDIPPPDHCEH
ncbi:MAG TPA: primary-amine oxidase [Acidimicrobiales bacterium]|nr:primary-amine oxidase [Acidimicrobiales bacterium]